MPIKVYKPTSPGRRGMSVSDFAELTKSKPEKSLLAPLHSNAGRNAPGEVSGGPQGAGHKRQYRIIDFKPHKLGVPAPVRSFEYVPNRSARIALLPYYA